MLDYSNTNIIVIDDDEEEAFELMTALAKKGISTVYYKGRSSSELPSEPIVGVRIVFLDIELGTVGLSDENKASDAAGKLCSCISDNGIYIVFAWTNNPNLIRLLKRYISTANKKQPLIVEKLDKQECKNSRGYSTKLILENVEKGLKKAGVFNIFLLWERLISKSSSIIINDLFSICSQRDRKKYLYNIIHGLAEAKQGAHYKRDNIQKTVEGGLLAFNGVFADTLEREIVSNMPNRKINNINFPFPTKILSKDVAKLNSKIHLRPFSKKPKPGNVYKARLKKDNVVSFFNTKDGTAINNQYNDFKRKGGMCIFIETSPLCRYNQKNISLCYGLSGVLIPVAFDISKIKKHAGYGYHAEPLLYVNKKTYKIMFDLRTYKTVLPIELKKLRGLCRLRNELLFKTQHEIARYFSSPGFLHL